MEFETRHDLHGLLFGLATYLLSKDPKISFAAGIAGYFYMSKYGHALPSMK
jgi:hypothetical protein